MSYDINSEVQLCTKSPRNQGINSNVITNKTEVIYGPYLMPGVEPRCLRLSF